MNNELNNKMKQNESLFVMLLISRGDIIGYSCFSNLLSCSTVSICHVTDHPPP